MKKIWRNTDNRFFFSMVFGFTLKEIRRKMVKQNVVFIFAFDCIKHPSLSLVNQTYTRTYKSNTLHFSIHIYGNICFFDAAIRQTIRSAMILHGIYRHAEEENQKNVVKRKNVARMIGKYREKKTMAKQQDVKKRTFDCELLLFFRHDRCADISTAKK